MSEYLYIFYYKEARDKNCEERNSVSTFLKR